MTATPVPVDVDAPLVTVRSPGRPDGATILIVDDIASHRAFLVGLLRDRGHRLLEAKDGSVALAIARAEHLDLIITDVLMPVMDGYEFVRQLRLDPATSGVPVLFYTAPYGEREARERARASGVAQVLKKPAEAEEVLKIVGRLLTGEAQTEEEDQAVRVSDREYLRLQMQRPLEEIGELRTATTRLRALINIGLDLMSKRDSARMLQGVCEAACDLFGATYVTLGILDLNELSVRRVVACGVDTADWIKTGDPVSGLLKAVVGEGRTYRGVNTPGQLPEVELPSRHPEVRAFLAAPIASAARVYGWILLVDNEGPGFSEDDEDLVQALAGQVGRIYELEHEVLERRHAETALNQSERLNRNLVAHLPHRILVKDLDSVILFCNDNYAADLGMPAADVVGKDAFAFYPPDLAEAYNADDRDVMASGQMKNFEESYEVNGHERWVHTVKVPYRNEQERVIGVLVVFEDITERKGLEAQFRQSQKLEGIGQLAGGVAHDFNNLLTVILGHCELLLADLAPGDAREADVVEIQKAGLSAAGLTRQLLAFSRKQIIEPTLLDLSVVVEEMRGMLGRLIGEDIKILLGLRPEQAHVKADRGQVEQIVMNLALNARDAMRGGGTLTIETASVELDEHYSAMHLAAASGSYVVLTVSDTGTGMTPAVQARLFEPFFTTKEPGSGTGLGLATVHGIVNQSGGLINVYSEVGHGTSFNVYFPRADSLGVVVVPPAPVVAAHRGTQTILVVEDAEGLRQLTKRLLQRQGYTVFAAANAEEARTLFAATPAIDLVLTDVVMPGGNGAELAADLLLQRPSLKVIYMSGYTREAIVQRGVLNPGIAFLHKPFTSESLGRKLGEVFAAEPVVTLP